MLASVSQRFSIGDRFAHEPPVLESVRAQVSVTLGARSSDGFELRDVASGLSFHARLTGSSPAPAETVDRTVVYRTALGTGSLLQRALSNGTEDFVAFDRAPDTDRIEYTIELGERVAGLRLVSSTLELVDAHGAPRLRVAPPYAILEGGARLPARLDVEQCAVDRDPSAPWGRTPTDPGARSCELIVSWDSARVTGALLVDPTWTTTGNMVAPRSDHTSTLLSNGKMLIVGGFDGAGALSSAELFDGTGSGTFAATGSTAEARLGHTASVLASGNVLVAGGASDPGPPTLLSTAEIYDVAAGTFGATGSLSTERWMHGAAVLDNGKVIVVGGQNYLADAMFTTEIYDAGTWTLQTDYLVENRRRPAVAKLRNGKVLAAGGVGISGSALSSAETYDPTTPAWTAVGAMRAARDYHSVVTLQSGDVLVVGGDSTGAPTTELFEVASSSFLTLPDMSAYRDSQTLSVLPSTGVVLVAGGGGLSTAELFDPKVRTWTSTTSLSTARSAHAASVLTDGRVIVTGGFKGADPSTYTYLSSAELFAPSREGAACASGSECATGYCVDGFCCGSDCATLCMACNNAATGAADGVCAPITAGTDPDGECNDQGATACGTTGTCDGNGACALYAKDTQCGASTCSNASLTTHACDGSGTCASTSISCLPYVCEGTTSCKSACTSDSDCAGLDNFCSSSGACQPRAAKCDGDHTITAANGETVNCAPYKCRPDGTCATECTTSSDCVSGKVCNTKQGQGVCVAAPNSGASSDSGCGCRTAGDDETPSNVWVVIGAAFLLLRRRARDGARSRTQ